MNNLSNTYARSPIPLYLQVAATLRRRIEDGYWKANERISTLEGLEAEFQVARVTVRQAIEILHKEGLVRRKQGRGTFVSNDIKDKRWLKLDMTWSSLIEAIADNVPTRIPVEDPPLKPALPPGEGKLADEYEYLRSVQSRNNEPFALVSVHIEKRIFDQAPHSFRTRTALPVLASLKKVNIGSARQSFIVGSSDPEIAHLLQIPLGAPTVEAHCVVADPKGVVIYVANIIYRGDCVRLDIDLLRTN